MVAPSTGPALAFRRRRWRPASLPATARALMAASALLIPAGSSPFTSPVAAQNVSGGALLPVEVATVGVDLNTGMPLALLHSGWSEVLPVWIGENEALAIARALQGVEFPRPMTHDLLVSTIQGMGGSLEEVRVHTLAEGTYFGSLHIRMGGSGNGELREIDSRPSDALALAVRTGARVRVARSLVDTAPDVDFLSAEGGDPIVRIRGVTVGLSRPVPGTRNARAVTVLHVTSEVAAWGLRAGDVVTAVEGTGVDSPLRFLETVRDAPAAGPVRLRIVRNGQEEELRMPPRRGEGRVG